MPIYPNTEPDPLIPTVSWVRGIFTELDNMIVGASTLGSKMQDPLIPSVQWVRLLYYNILSKISCPSTYGGQMIDPLIPSTEWVRALYYDLKNRIENCNQPPVELPLSLTFDAIGNAPVVDPSDVAQWNTFFGLPANGTPFTSVEVIGNQINLYGGSGITLFSGCFSSDGHITLIQDDALCVVACAAYAITGCTILNDITLNACITFGDGAVSGNYTNTSIGLRNFRADNATDFGAACFDVNSAMDNCIIPKTVNIWAGCFNNCTMLLTLSIPLCTNLGGTVGDDNVFVGSGLASGGTLTVPIALQTCNTGSPDGDIQAISATIIYV